jgi:hypothetical protein
MRTRANKVVGLAAVLALGWAAAVKCYGGTPKKWEQVPEAVRATILANGGKAGSVDLESGKINGQPCYEAIGKDKAGNEVDLVITQDGKLVTTKSDHAADRAQEQAAKAKKSATPKFSHSREITHPYLPLGLVNEDILEGQEDGKQARVERTAKPDLHKTFKLGKQKVEALVIEDRVFEDGKLMEVALDYFAQADDGTVYYLGEDVDEYKDGKVVGHEGAWLLGVHTQTPGVLLPANPKVGDKFKSEEVPKITTEGDEVMSLSETVTVPAGTFQNCLKVKELLSDGKTEYKYYAKGVGCVKELPADGELALKSHTTRGKAP